MNGRGWIPGMMALAALAGGCSDAELVGPDGTARTEVVMVGDGTEGGSASPSREAYRSSSQAEAGGAIDVRAKVYIRMETGEWVALTEEAVSGTVAAGGSASGSVLARADIGATSYDRVRVEFEEVRGSTGGGLTIGGSLVGAEVRVETGGDGRVVVEREVRFRAEGEATTRLVIDLRASEWMEAGSEGAGVAEAAFSGAVRITARQS